jgi:hypothetical protein
VSYTFWSQATRVEVYSLHVLLSGFVLLVALRYRRTGHHLDLAAALLSASLGLAHHLTIVLLVPTVLALCGPRLWRERTRLWRLLAVGGLLVIGPALYGLLVIWTRAGSLLCWGRPVNLALLWNHASARFYRGYLQLPEGDLLFQGMEGACALLLDSFPYLSSLLCIAGSWALWKRDRGVATGFLLAMLTISSYNLCYQIKDISPYYLIVWMVAAALLAVALDSIQTRSALRMKGVPLAGVLFILLLGASLLRNWSACDLSGATWVREFARHKLENTDPGGVLVSQNDSDTFPIWYVQEVLRVRPDVISVDRAMTDGAWLNYDKDPSLWYLAYLRARGVRAPLLPPPASPTEPHTAGGGYLVQLLSRELRDRPLFMTFASSKDRRSNDPTSFLRWVTGHYEIVPQGIILRLHSRTTPVDLKELLSRNEQLWDRMTLPEVRAVRTDQDLDPTYVVNHYACMLTNLGGLYEKAGNHRRAASLYRRAAGWAPGYRPAVAALRALQRNAEAPRHGSSSSRTLPGS